MNARAKNRFSLGTANRGKRLANQAWNGSTRAVSGAGPDQAWWMVFEASVLWAATRTR